MENFLDAVLYVIVVSVIFWCQFMLGYAIRDEMISKNSNISNNYCNCCSMEVNDNE